MSLVSLGDVEARVSFRGDMGSRPRGATRALSWGLDLADFEAVPIKLTGFEVENAVMLWSVCMRCVQFCAPPFNGPSSPRWLSSGRYTRPYMHAPVAQRLGRKIICVRHTDTHI